MLTLVEALNYRCLKYVSRPLDRFHVLVGPNASGKTTFLDVVAFISRLVSSGLEAAIETRSPTFHDLLFRHEGGAFELAIEAVLPSHLREKIAEIQYDVARYEVAVQYDHESQTVRIEKEVLRFRQRTEHVAHQLDLFPRSPAAPGTIFQRGRDEHTARKALTRTATGRANYYSETYKETGKGWNPQWDLRVEASALANLPADENKFPVSTWFKNLISAGVETIVLDSLAMRNPSAPGQGKRFKTDGSNLPWVIEDLYSRNPERFQDWIDHVRTALPDVVAIRTVERPEDRHRYLMIEYEGGLEIPSWTASDGTLRLLALTLPAYLEQFEGILLIEEPENGIHPRAIETMFQAAFERPVCSGPDGNSFTGCPQYRRCIRCLVFCEGFGRSHGYCFRIGTSRISGMATRCQLGDVVCSRCPRLSAGWVMKDLAILAADSQISQTLLGLLPRHQALSIRPISIELGDIKVHPNKDAGCRKDGAAILRTLTRQYRHALLIFDHDGCGREVDSAIELENCLDTDLNRCGWNDRARTVVIDPELETWVWSPSLLVDEILGWSSRVPGLRKWLVQQSFVETEDQKPNRPKEAMLAALKEVRKLPSAALFKKLAARVTFQECQDRSFLRLRSTLNEWFSLKNQRVKS